MGDDMDDGDDPQPQVAYRLVEKNPKKRKAAKA